MQLKKSLTTFIKTKSLFLLFFLASIGFFIGLVAFSSVFRIQNIVVVGKNQNIFGLAEVKNKNILFTSSKSIEDELFARNPTISEIAVEKEYPSTIRIEVSFYQSVAYLETKDGFIELGSTGRILQKTQKKDKSIPEITYYQSVPYHTYQTGQFITFKDILYSLYFAERLKELGIRINNVDINGFYMLRLYSDKNQTFITTTDKEKKVQYAQLEKIYKQFKLNSTEFQSIDVRFDKPVATF